MTWINRHGGCARRSNKRSEDFEDYGLADTDFPHNHQPHMRSPGMQTVSLAANGAAIGSGSAVNSAAMTPALGAATAAATSPTIPRLNDQGTFYGASTVDDPYNNSQQQFMPAYQPQLENNHQQVIDYNNVPMDYSQQQQQSYYYQQPQDPNMGVSGGYYDESGYYYDGSAQQQQAMPTAGATANHSHNPSYDMTAQYTNQQYPSTNANVHMGDQHYKPDQVDMNSHHQRM